MPEKFMKVPGRRAVLLLLGATAVSWKTRPNLGQVPQKLSDDQFVIINGWVVPRHLLSPAHVG